MAFALGPIATAADYGLVEFENVGSTNDEAMARARAGETGPLWIVARSQSGGRGRRGRVWSSPVGNLYTTLMIGVQVPPAIAATLGFVAGLALDRAVNETDDHVRVGLDGAGAPHGTGRVALKWPNDVVADGAKIAGIGLESEPLPGGGHALAVGIGVNVATAPDGLPYPATSLAALKLGVTAEQLFSGLSDAWVDIYRIWRSGHGMAEIRRMWLARAAGLGSPVAVNLGSSVVRGVFETIDEDGRLVIRLDDGSATLITAGDVHFGGVASAGAR
jgi:BirA family transcriptional regulator, biotin operon repressor / biotin---[acetyl-CoA-carboxylase] ligase